jgi:glycosyltransferase involved in cell wall biosynthesis
MAWRLLVAGDLGRAYLAQVFSRGGPSGGAPVPVLVDGVGHASALRKLRTVFSPVVVIHQNFEPDYYADAYEGHWSKKLWVRAGWRAERLAARDGDLHLFVTKEDLHRYREAFGVPFERCAVIGVQEDIVSIGPARRPADDMRLRVVITGTMSDRKGVVGLLELLRYLGRHRARLSDRLCFIVVGRGASNEVRTHADGTFVQLRENVPDVGAEARACDVYVNPNYTGSGIKVRNLDGLRNGLPVLCRRENAAGFCDLPSDVFDVFSSNEELLERLLAMGLDDVACEARRNAVHRVYASVFSIEEGARRLRTALRVAGFERASP